MDRNMRLNDFGKRLFLFMTLAFLVAFFGVYSVEAADGKYHQPQFGNGKLTDFAGVDIPATAITVGGSADAVTWGIADTESWYIVNSNVEITGRITVAGMVNLILCDDCTLTAPAGITVSNNDPKNPVNGLAIFAQSEGPEMGALKIEFDSNNTTNNNAAIGGTQNKNGSNITINGGNITASASGYGAGIGGGYKGEGSNITINGGDITATGGSHDTTNGGAGIGGGYSNTGSNIKINGGKVTAKGGGHSAGIGGGTGKSGSDITINGGIVNATGGAAGAGIGGGSSNPGHHISITGGAVTATGGSGGAGIGGGSGSGGVGYSISISGTETSTSVTAKGAGTSGNGSAGIGGGCEAAGYGISISGGVVDAYGGINSPAIGNGYRGKYSASELPSGDVISISGGRITAQVTTEGSVTVSAIGTYQYDNKYSSAPIDLFTAHTADMRVLAGDSSANAGLITLSGSETYADKIVGKKYVLATSYQLPSSELVVTEVSNAMPAKMVEKKKSPASKLKTSQAQLLSVPR